MLTIFVMLEFSAMAELNGTVYQTGHEDFTQRVMTSSPREGPKPKAQWRLKMKHLNVKRKLKTFYFGNCRTISDITAG